MRKMIIRATLLGLLILSNALWAQEWVNAIRDGKIEAYKSMLEADASLLNQGDDRQCRAIHWATNFGHIDLATCSIGRFKAVETFLNVGSIGGQRMFGQGACAGRTEHTQGFVPAQCPRRQYQIGEAGGVIRV